MRKITQCPKCGSERIAFAHDEAPGWAKQWTKCFACGKRWNLGGPPKRRVEDEEEATEETEETPATKRNGDEIVKLVMSLSKHETVNQKEHMSKREEPAMGAPSRICLEIVRTGTRCTTGAARGSDYCQRHRAKREPGDRVAASPTLPAKRPNAPITLAEPTMVNPTANGHGRATASGLDELILTFESNLATLRAAKALLEIHG